MKKRWICGLTAFTILGLSSCYPDNAEYVHELDTALTHYDEKTVFTDYQTFTLLDSLVYIKESSDTARIERGFDEKILSLIRQNMETYNYTYIPGSEISNTNKPDIVITVSAFSNPYYYFNYGYSWFDHWGWFPGWTWFGGTFSGYYPWYPWIPGGYIEYGYTNGTLSIEMLNPQGAEQGSKRIPVLWTGIIDGILAGSQNYINTRLEQHINQCFIQSPYLKTNK